MARTPLIIDFRTPAEGFANALDLWLACHDRTLIMARMVDRLRYHVSRTGADRAARTTAASVRRYFDEAAPRHHEDEEIDLFPCLRARLKGRGSRRLATAMDRLRDDHRTLSEIWSVLRPALVEIESGTAVVPDTPVVADFVSGYQGHCETENELIAPALAQALTAEQMMVIAESMARRRAIAWDVLAARH